MFLILSTLSRACDTLKKGQCPARYKDVSIDLIGGGVAVFKSESRVVDCTLEKRTIVFTQIFISTDRVISVGRDMGSRGNGKRTHFCKYKPTFPP